MPALFVLIIKDSNLGPVPQLQLIEDRTQVIPYSSFAQIQSRGNLLIAQPVGYEPDDFQFSVIDILGSVVEGRGPLEK